jgi:hypothetical protein
MLEEAHSLMPDDETFLSQLEAARAKKQTNDQIFGYLQQADAARSRGDFTAARSIVEKAIELDANNSRLRAAYKSLARQAEDAARQAKVKQLLDSARDALQRRNYQDVLDLVGQAQPLDPENYEIREFERAARTGIAQEKRRRLLEDIEDQISAIVTREDAERVAEDVHQELEKTPADATLLRYQAQIGRIVREHRNKALVDETLNRCSIAIEEAPLDALEQVRNSLLNVPGDPRLVAMEHRIQQRIEHMTAEEARDAVLLQAREFLKQRNFPQAVDILQKCKTPVLTPEILELLAYARQEAADDEHQQFVTRLYEQAQVLSREEKYEELVALLRPVAQGTGDLRLQAMLGEATRTVESRRAEEAAVIDLIKPFAESECHEQVVALSLARLDKYPSSAAILALQEASQKAFTNEWRHFESAGAAYASLDSGDWSSAALNASTTDAPASMVDLQKLLSNRRTVVVDRILANQVKFVQQAASDEVQIDAVFQLAQNKNLLPFASDAVKTEWLSLASQYEKSDKIHRAFARVGKWIPRTK